MAGGRESPLFHPPTVLRQLNAFRHHNLYCDVTISVAGTKFRCHRAVLAANSVFFHHLLLPGNPGVRLLPGDHGGRRLLPGDWCYHLDHMGAPTFSALLQYMYTSQLFLSDPHTARDLLHGARSLGLLSLVDLVADYLLDTDSGDGDDRTEPSGAEEGEGEDVLDGNDSVEVDGAPTDNRPLVKEEATVKLDLQQPADPGCTGNPGSVDNVPQEPAELGYPHNSAHKIPQRPADPGCQQSSVNSVEVPENPADPGYACSSAPEAAGTSAQHEDTQVLDKVMTLLQNLSELVSTNGRQEMEVITADSSHHISHGLNDHIRHGHNDQIRHDESGHISQEKQRSRNSADLVEQRSGNSAELGEQRSRNSADLVEQRPGNSAELGEHRSGNSANLLEQRSGNMNDLLGQSSAVFNDLEESSFEYSAMMHTELEKLPQDMCTQNMSVEERKRREEMGREEKRTAGECAHNRQVCSTEAEWVRHASYQAVMRHSKTTPRERGWTTKHCREVRSRKQLQEHHFRHKGRKRKDKIKKNLTLRAPKQCPDCKRTFYRTDGIRHRCTHKNSRVCRTCGKLTSQACLGLHVLSRRQHTCETCGKYLICKRHLHLPGRLVQEGSTQCERTFISSVDSKSHLAMHDKTAPQC